jgi:hypothetical protein
VTDVPPDDSTPTNLYETGLFVRDLAERVGSTLVVTFIGTFFTALSIDALDGQVDISGFGAAAIAGFNAAIVACGTVVKGLLARRRGNPNSASLLKDTSE